MSKNIMQMVEPMTNGFYAAKGGTRPEEPVALTDPYKRFLWDNVYSEIGELYLYTEKHEQVDAIVDIAIYTIDVCLRNGYDKHYLEPIIESDYDFSADAFQTFLNSALKNVLTGHSVITHMESCFGILHICQRAMTQLGYPLAPFVELVANYNNSKLVDGVAILNDKDKIMKPDGWVAPDRDIKVLMEKYDNA